MAYFTTLWKAGIVDKCKREYEDEKINSILASNTEIPRKTTSVMQKWRIYRRDTKTRLTGKLKKVFPEGSSVSNLYYYLKTDQTFPNFVLKSVVGFLGGIVLTYLCFMFFVFQLSISLMHATIMSSVIGVLLTLGLAFSYRIRCLVFLLIPQLFSRVGRYTLTCYALVLILTGPATNTFKNSEVLSESMACSQEQIKTSVRQINESIRKPFNAMKDTVKLMVETIKRLTSTLDEVITRIRVLVISISDVIQSSLSWLNSVGDACNKKFGAPYDYCMKAVNRGVLNCKNTFKDDLTWLCSASLAAKTACWTVRPYKSVCFIADYATTSFAATMKRKLRVFTDRINRMFSLNIETQHTYTFTSNASDSASQVAAGIVTELRNRADPLLTWLSWSSCVTSLFLLLFIFRAKYYQHMFETRSRFDNRYVTQELRELDLKRYREGRETVLPLNRREKAKYINVTSFRLVTSEKLHLTRSMVFMTITTFKLLIHIVADYSLYWVLMTIRYHGRFQTILPPGPSDAGVHISGYGIVADFIRSIFDALSIPLVQKVPSPVTCLPNPYPPDLQRYTQIAVLIMLLWFFALFEPYGLRLRHVIMGHYRPERAKTRAVWLYNHILRTRGSFMKLARRKLHREYKYSDQEHLTFRHWINSLLPCWCLRYMFGTLLKEPHCLLCNTFEEVNDSDTKLINCKTATCPGVYCTRCFCDIGHLCTICLSPEDYGDMSDLSLEKGSSDDSSDQQCEDDGNHNNNRDIAFQRKKGHDDERERLIKRSDANTKSKRKEPSNEHNNQAEDEISLISSDDEPQHKTVNSRFTKYLIKYETNTLLLSLMKNKTNIVFKEHTDLNNNSYFKVHRQKNMQKCIDLYNFEKYIKAHDDKRQKVYSIENCFKFRKRCRNKLKRNVKNNKWHHFLRILSNKLRFRHLKIFKCFGLRCDYIKIFNNYHIKSTNRSFQVYKINAHSRKLKKFKRGYYKPSNQKNQNIINYMTHTSNIQKIFLTSSKYKTSKNKDQKSKKNRDIDFKALSNNIESRKNKKEKDSKDANICKKHNKIAKNKHSSNGVQKLCSFCSCFLNCKDSPSREIVEGSECCCLKDKPNFKRRKKAAKDNKSEIISNKNRMAKEKNINDRNYRLSSYLSDQSWLWQKLCKDSEKERMKKVNVLCDLAELRIAVTDQQTKEARLLKVIKKAFKKTTHECRCPSNVCVCELQPSNNKKLNKNRDIINKTSFDSKKYYCKYLSSKISASKANKADHQSPKYVDQDSITEQRVATESPDAQLARRLNFYTSLGNHDFEAIDDIPQAGTTCSKEKSNTSSETTVPSNIASTSKTKSSKQSYSQRFDLDWLATNIKLVKIKDIKLAISERFLHLRMKNPLPMMRDIYSTLLEASSKNKKGTKYEEYRMDKETDDKGVTVLPIVKTCSCQHIDVPTAHEDRTTQIDKKRDKNTTQPIVHKHLRDAEVEVVAQTCTCATQYTKRKHKTCSCMKEDKDTKEFGDTANIEDYSSDETESNVTLSTISLAEDTKTDTTVCSRVTIDYEVSPSRAKPKKNVRKVKVDVITKANQGTSTDRAKQCDVSTITSDWWSPIVEKKLGKVHLGRGEMYEKRRPRKKSYKDRSVCTDGRIVTFMSRAQIIPTETGDILSPSRYLLESQKYYNELFSSRFYSPRVYPVNIKGTKDCEKQWFSRDSNRKGRKTKRLNRKNSPRLKISKSNIEKIRSGETIRNYSNARS